MPTDFLALSRLAPSTDEPGGNKTSLYNINTRGRKGSMYQVGLQYLFVIVKNPDLN